MRTTPTLKDFLQQIQDLPRDKDILNEVFEELELVRDEVVTVKEAEERIKELLKLNGKE